MLLNNNIIREFTRNPQRTPKCWYKKPSREPNRSRNSNIPINQHYCSYCSQSSMMWHYTMMMKFGGYWKNRRKGSLVLRTLWAWGFSGSLCRGMLMFISVPIRYVEWSTSSPRSWLLSTIGSSGSTPSWTISATRYSNQSTFKNSQPKAPTKSSNSSKISSESSIKSTTRKTKDGPS